MTALAMVFSVQQGKHGPLVVYKLTMPKSTQESVTLPREHARPPVPAQPTVLDPLAFSSLYRPDPESEIEPPLVNAETGARLTLEDVGNALTWRRDTAKRLRRTPVGPRF